jgi:hypothetical protein
MAVPRRMFLYSPISLEYPIGKEENAKKWLKEQGLCSTMLNSLLLYLFLKRIM